MLVYCDFLIAYLDDMIKSELLEQYVEHLKTIFENTRLYGFKKKTSSSF